jgi:Ca2+-transporting ATPase
MTVIEAWIAGDKYDRVEERPQKLATSVFDILCDSIAINSKANIHVDDAFGTTDYIGNKTECAMLLMLHKYNVNYNTIRKDSADGVTQM